MTLNEALNLAAPALSAGALLVSWLSWKRAAQSTRAALFERRFELYRDVELFLSTWARNGCPDMNELHLIVGAHNRAHFLFDRGVVAFLRLLWLDAAKADHLRKIVSGEIPGDRDRALDEQNHLFNTYCVDENVLRNAFMPSMRIENV